MAQRLTAARQARGLAVDQIASYLIQHRMSSKSPRKRRLWIGTIRKWFHYGLEEIPGEFAADFDLMCELLGIPSVDVLWVDDSEPSANSET